MQLKITPKLDRFTKRWGCAKKFIIMFKSISKNLQRTLILFCHKPRPLSTIILIL
jgi:hypothetical protein